MREPTPTGGKQVSSVYQPGAFLEFVVYLLGAAVGAAAKASEVGGLAGQLPALAHNHRPALPWVGDVAAADAVALAVEVLAAETR